ncbi:MULTISPECIES: hypothetical protein [unclassified Streptomyces]|uniref:hypothetical protein n=1 Tax=unclassified Streptomyces TaxID=2593676 RepID=UPI0036675416
MPTTAEQLLSVLEPLPFPARLTLTAQTAHRLATAGELGPLLAELDALGPYERRLAALAAFAGRDTDFLAARLADPDRCVASYALRAARRLPVPDGAIEAAYEDAPTALRQRLARLLLRGGRTALTERLVERLRGEWGDAEAARLLPACSAPFVARHLPSLAHAVDGWPGFARRHPDAVLDHFGTALAERSPGHERDTWWRVHATAVSALAPQRPTRVLDLLERYGPAALPHPMYDGLGALIDVDADRVVRWITSPDRRAERYERVPPPRVTHRLVRAAPVSLPALGRHWGHRDRHYTALLKALPPGSRQAFHAEVTAGAPGTWPHVDVLALLPREQRWAAVRRAEAEFDPAEECWWEDLDVLGHGPFTRSRTALLAAVVRSDADDRETAWPLLVAGATRDGGRAAVAEMLEATRRLRNDRDPVRLAALRALAAEAPGVLHADDVAALERIATDALEAPDGSDRSRTALRTLAERVLVEHALGPDTALSSWALDTLGRITGLEGVPSFGPLYRVLRRGQEHQVFDSLRPWLEGAAARADFRLLLGLARALGPRARRMPDLQDMLVTALERGDDATFRAAVELRLDEPGTRGPRVAAIIALEPSAVVLPPVLDVVSRSRTDLLDALLDDAPPQGRFLLPGSPPPLPDLDHSGRWLTRQQAAAVRIAAAAAADVSLPLAARAAAIRAAAPVPGLGYASVMAHTEAPDVVLAEAALGALPRTDRPREAVAVLLERAGTDRARVAVYAAARAADHTAPSELALLLGPLLTGEQPAKVTSRKEAVRLAALHLPPRRAAALLAHAFRAPDRHPDVRSAVVRALPVLLGVPEAWQLLDEAAREGDPAVVAALVAVGPRQLPREHRARWAGLVDSLYDAVLSHTASGFWGHSSIRSLGDWAAHAPGLAERLSRTVCDLDRRAHWAGVASVLRDLASSTLPHPLGGGAPGSVLHGAVAELLVSLDGPVGGLDATGDRDLPALQRLRSLVYTSAVHESGPELPEALAGQLAGHPLLAPERADLLRSLVDLHAEPYDLARRLEDLAGALEDAGVVVAGQVAGRLRPHWGHRVLPARAASLLTVADRLARDGRVGAGLLAAALVAGMGTVLSWPEEWRVLLRALRRHPRPDVRREAFHTLTEAE